MKHALVTGVSSTLGYEIARQLFYIGMRVQGIVNSRSTNLIKLNDSYSEINWGHFVGDERASFGLGKNSVIIHAATVVPSRFIEHSSFNFNVQSTEYLMNIAVKQKTPLLIYFSTMSVYGAVHVPQLYENLVSLDASLQANLTLDDYGRSKLLSERILKSMASDATKVVVVRLPGVLGRRSDYNFVSQMLKKFKANSPVTIKNPFACFNNLALDSEVGRFCRYLIDQTACLPPFSVVNFAAAGIFSVQELVLELKKLAKSDSMVEYADDGGISFTICIRRLRELGFEPANIDEVLTKFVSRYDEPIHV